MWYDYENKANFFIVNCFLLLFATGLGLLILKRLNAVMKEKGIN
jgi:POT family proton-dependent oligopeptide transporter